MTGGGVNWGGAAFDPVNQILYANTSRAMHIVKLIPRAEAEGFKPPKAVEFGQQRGAAYAMTRRLAISPLGILCNKPPWGEMVAVDLKAGKILWQSSVGTAEDKAPLGIAFNWGTPLVNGVVVTAGGLVFTGAMDAYLRAFDAKSGAELWQGRLPVPGIANPMTYLWKGEQYVGDRRRRPFREPAPRSATAWWRFGWRGRARRPRCGRAPSTGPAGGSGQGDRACDRAVAVIALWRWRRRATLRS